MTKENVSLLSFVMRFDKFGILDFLELLYLWLDYGSSAIRIDGFGIDLPFYFVFPFLIDIDIRADTRLGLDNLPCKYIRYLIWQFLESRVILTTFTKFIGQLFSSHIISFSFLLQLLFHLRVVTH